MMQSNDNKYVGYVGNNWLQFQGPENFKITGGYREYDNTNGMLILFKEKDIENENFLSIGYKYSGRTEGTGENSILCYDFEITEWEYECAKRESHTPLLLETLLIRLFDQGGKTGNTVQSDYKWMTPTFLKIFESLGFKKNLEEDLITLNYKDFQEARKQNKKADEDVVVIAEPSTSAPAQTETPEQSKTRLGGLKQKLSKTEKFVQVILMIITVTIYKWYLGCKANEIFNQNNNSDLSKINTDKIKQESKKDFFDITSKIVMNKVHEKLVKAHPQLKE